MTGAVLLRAMLEAPPLHAATPVAEPAEPFRIIWSSSAACSHADTFSTELRSRTNRLRPAQEGEHAILLVVETFETASGVRGQLTVRMLNGAITVREVPGSNCHEVESAMALIAALMMDPLAGSTKPPPPLKQSNWSTRVDGRLTTRTAVAPKWAWGGSLGATLTREASRFRPSFGLSAHFATGSASQPAGSADLEWAAAQLSLCPWGFQPGTDWDLRVCGLFQAGRLHVAAFDTPNAAKKSVFWSSAGLQLEGRFKLLGPLWLGLEGAVELPFSRASFYLDPAQTLHQVPAWGMSFGAGLGVLFF